jgi:hypothetical protein
MKIDVRCGFGVGKPCANWVGEIEREGFPGPLWFRDGNYDRLRWDERDYVCDKHGMLEVYDEDLLRLSLKPRKRYSIMAKSVPG